MHSATSSRGKEKLSEAGAYCASDSVLEIKKHADDDSAAMPRGRHNHLSDVGFGAFSAYFFCMLSSVSIRSNGFGAMATDESVVLAFFVFRGCCCLRAAFSCHGRAVYDSP